MIFKMQIEELQNTYIIGTTVSKYATKTCWNRPTFKSGSINSSGHFNRTGLRFLVRNYCVGNCSFCSIIVAIGELDDELKRSQDYPEKSRSHYFNYCYCSSYPDSSRDILF